jgi:hypothetical protein
MVNDLWRYHLCYVPSFIQAGFKNRSISLRRVDSQRGCSTSQGIETAQQNGLSSRMTVSCVATTVWGGFALRRLALRNFAHTNFCNEMHTNSLARQPNANTVTRNLPNKTEHVLTKTRIKEETSLSRCVKHGEVFTFPLLFRERIPDRKKKLSLRHIYIQVKYFRRFTQWSCLFLICRSFFVRSRT